MDVIDFLKGKLEDLCHVLFPGSLVEIERFAGVGIWPYIIGPDGEEIEGEEIARRLISYQADPSADSEYLRAVAATKYCLEVFKE